MKNLNVRNNRKSRISAKRVHEFLLLLMEFLHYSAGRIDHFGQHRRAYDVYEVLVSSLGWDSSYLGAGLSWLLSLPSGIYQNGTLH
jgi:hypothetical protein